MKKELVGLLIFSLIIFLSSGIFAIGESCFITDRSSCEASGYVVMGLSSTTNAHGELANQSNYNNVLCCNFAGSLTCDGTNKIIGLSSSTNAHTEIPTETTYSTEVCYSDLDCISTSLNCGDTGYNLSIFSLSNYTNAHIGEINDYNIKICCTSASFVVSSLNVYWSNDGTNKISTLDVVIGTTSVKMVLKNSGLSQGTIVNFEVKEDDPMPNPDDNIRTISQGNAITATIDSNGDAIAEWTITLDDLENTNDYEEFYFEVNGEESGYLELTVLDINYCNNIILCGDYGSEISCGDNNCQIGESDSPTNVNCDDPTLNCYCSWNNQCNFNFDLIPSDICGDGTINAGATCDGSNFGPINGCSDFDAFTGGTLKCYAKNSGVNECQFDTFSCTGGIPGGVVGDGIINIGETCDGSNFGPINGCSDFDAFTGGILQCDETGHFDTSQCTGGIGTGTCVFSESTSDDCSDGFLSYSWTSSWSETSAVSCTTDSECNTGNGEYCKLDQGICAPSSCAPGSRVIECPAQIQLPFFGVYNLIAAILLIAIIYFIIFNKKKLRKFIK